MLINHGKITITTKWQEFSKETTLTNMIIRLFGKKSWSSPDRNFLPWSWSTPTFPLFCRDRDLASPWSWSAPRSSRWSWNCTYLRFESALALLGNELYLSLNFYTNSSIFHFNFNLMISNLKSVINWLIGQMVTIIVIEYNLFLDNIYWKSGQNNRPHLNLIWYLLVAWDQGNFFLQSWNKKQ